MARRCGVAAQVAAAIAMHHLYLSVPLATKHFCAETPTRVSRGFALVRGTTSVIGRICNGRATAPAPNLTGSRDPAGRQKELTE